MEYPYTSGYYITEADDDEEPDEGFSAATDDDNAEADPNAEESTEDSNDAGEDDATDENNEDDGEEETDDDETSEEDFDIDTEEDTETDDDTDEDPNADSSSDTGDSSDDEPEETKLKDGDIFDSLSPQEQKLKIKVLKGMYVDLYSSVSNIADKLGNIMPDDQEIAIQIKSVISILFDLKRMINDYFMNLFNSKSYIENDIMYNKYLFVLNAVKGFTEELKKRYNDDNMEV